MKMKKTDIIKKYKRRLARQEKLWADYKKAKKAVDDCPAEDYRRYCMLEKKWLSFNSDGILARKKVYKEILKDMGVKI